MFTVVAETPKTLPNRKKGAGDGRGGKDLHAACFCLMMSAALSLARANSVPLMVFFVFCCVGGKDYASAFCCTSFTG